MNYNDHPPPHFHFHVRYGKQRALIDIDSFRVLRGQLSPPVLGLVVEWAVQHRAELTEHWTLALRQQALQPLDLLR